LNTETGHFIRIQIPARARTLWLNPGWAVLCGIVASGAFVWTGRDLLVAALTIMLADAVWATVWWGLVETDWPSLLSYWPTLEVDDSGQPWLLARPGSPAERTRLWLARLRVWWRTVVWPEAGTPILSAIVSITFGLVLSAVVGWQALSLSLGALALVQIGVLQEHRHGRASHLARGMMEVGLAWMLGHAAFGQLSPLSVLMAVLLSVAYGSSIDLAQGGRQLRGWLLPQLLAAMVIIVLQQPLAAFALIALLVAQALLATVMRGLPFARSAQWWLMLAMLVAALAVRP
jgi:hypothetical protein